MPEPLLSHADALRFVDTCEASDVQILGIDRVTLTEDGEISPDLGGILDNTMTGQSLSAAETAKSSRLFLGMFGSVSNERFIFTTD